MQIFSYISPDQIIPLATPIAMAMGFVMMFGRNVVRLVTNFGKMVFNRRGLVAVAEQTGEESQILAFPQIVAASSRAEQHQSTKRSA